MTAKAKAPETGRTEGAAAPVFTRAQLMGAKRFEYPRDVAAAVLAEDKSYTMDEAQKLVQAFLERKVK